MWTIILVLFVGMIIGMIIRPEDKTKKRIGQLQFLGVMILLFAMGAGLGLNDQLLSNLSNMGIEALVFAIMTSVFSIGIVYFVSKLLIKEGQ